MLSAELLEFSVNRPLAKSENERHNYAGDWNEHKQAQRPMVAGFVEYPAKDDRLNNKYRCCYCQNKEHDNYGDARAKGVKNSFRIEVRIFHFIFLSLI